MKNKNLFRLKHIRECITKIEYLTLSLHTQDNFETDWIKQGCYY
jgi:hypothetical protein